MKRYLTWDFHRLVLVCKVLAYKDFNRYGEWMFDSEERALKTAITLTRGSRSENCPIIKNRDSEGIYGGRKIICLFDSSNWKCVKKVKERKKRDSLVPAAAVIPALLMNGEIDVVKKLVVWIMWVYKGRMMFVDGCKKSVHNNLTTLFNEVVKYFIIFYIE